MNENELKELKDLKRLKIELAGGEKVNFPLGNLIKQKRKERRLTQRQLAKEIQISSSVLSQIESGFRLPTSSIWEKLSDTLELERSEEKCSQSEIFSLWLSQKKVFGLLIRLKRLENDFRLSEFADYLGVDPAFLSRLEAGKEERRSIYLEPLFEELGIDEQYFQTFELQDLEQIVEIEEIKFQKRRAAAKKILGTLIRSTRKKRKLTLYQLAMQLGVDNSTLSKIETEARWPRMSLYRKIIEILSLDEQRFGLSPKFLEWTRGARLKLKKWLLLESLLSDPDCQECGFRCNCQKEILKRLLDFKSLVKCKKI